MTEFLGETLDVIGKIMIAYTAVMVHYRFRKEHRVDDAVFHAMRREHAIGIIGIIFILAGYLLRVPF